MPLSAQHLAFHGTLVLLFGLFLGAPYSRAIKRDAPSHVVNSWRVAHASLPMGALLMFAVAALLPHFNVSEGLAWFLAVVLIVSSYAFCVSTSLAAVTGQRGLGWAASHGLGRVVYACNVLGAFTSLVGAGMLVLISGNSLFWA
jgi:hypothetical protein